MTKLVSILMPCYNAAGLLPMALASLLAQTYEEWECILVDDASTDHPETVVAAIHDSRIRLIRLEQNRGAGFARQVTLDESRGEFITMLDADDWLYPRKLEVQVKVLQDRPELAAVSSGMAILKTGIGLAGVRRRLCTEIVEVHGPLKPLKKPLLAFAPSMLRRTVARSHRFDERMRRVEDLAWLMKVLPGERYGIMPDILYAYCEYTSFNPRKAEKDLNFERQMYRSYLREYPVESRIESLKVIGKSNIYRALRRLGLAEWAIANRTLAPSTEETHKFLEAQCVVEDCAARVFRTPSARTGTCSS